MQYWKGGKLLEKLLKEKQSYQMDDNKKKKKKPGPPRKLSYLDEFFACTYET